MKSMMICGFDVGLRNSAYGIIRANFDDADPDVIPLELVSAGMITTPSKMPYAESLRSIRDQTLLLLHGYAIDVVGIEDVHPPIGRNIGSIKGTAMVIGVLHETVWCVHELEPRLVSPSHMKVSITGNGKADKKMVAKVVRDTLISPSLKVGHVTDALAVALTVLGDIELEL